VAAVAVACRCRPPQGEWPPRAASVREAFDALAKFFSSALAADGGPVTFLLDEFLDVRTFESFPGLRHALHDLLASLSDSSNQFVLASQFTARVHRLLRDAPARFEVMHVSRLEPHEVTPIALAVDGARADWARAVTPAVTVLADGRPAYIQMLLSAAAQMGSASDPVATLASVFAPDGRLTSACRAAYEFRLHRARGYGALKAILGVLAEEEALNLTEIAHRLHRTPGSTKDYLSWLEDVDLVTSQRKRYSYEDPVLRLFVRLHGRAVPPTDDDLVREVQAYAHARLGRLPESSPVPTANESGAGLARDAAIIEID
jgi:hypothetical protein